MQSWHAYATDCEQNCSDQYYDFIDFCHDSANRKLAFVCLRCSKSSQPI